MYFLKGAILSNTDRKRQRESRRYFIRHQPAVQMMFYILKILYINGNVAQKGLG